MGAGPSVTSGRRKMRCLYQTQSHQKKGVNPSSSGRRRRKQNSHRRTPDLPNNAILCPDLAPLSVFGIKLAAEIIVNNQIKFPSTMHAYHYYKSMKRMSCRYLKRNKIKKEPHQKQILHPTLLFGHSSNREVKLLVRRVVATSQRQLSTGLFMTHNPLVLEVMLHPEATTPFLPEMP